MVADEVRHGGGRGTPWWRTSLFVPPGQQLILHPDQLRVGAVPVLFLLLALGHGTLRLVSGLDEPQADQLDEQAPAGALRDEGFLGTLATAPDQPVDLAVEHAAKGGTLTRPAVRDRRGAE